VFCEHKLMYDLRTEVPDEAYTIPFGEANVVRDGDDVTLVALARMVHYSMEAAEKLAAEGIECEVIDPRTTSPLDEDTILDSVERTGRLVVVDEATPRCSMATDIAALVADRAFAALKAPVRRVTAPQRRCRSRHRWRSSTSLIRPNCRRGARGARIRPMSAPIARSPCPVGPHGMRQGFACSSSPVHRSCQGGTARDRDQQDHQCRQADAAGTLTRIVARGRPCRSVRWR
jgi:hypothetical protein